VLILDGNTERSMKEQAEGGYPREVCGLLLGRFEDRRQVRQVSEAHAAGNLNQDRSGDRYDMDPTDYLRIENAGRARGLEVVGVYHSHPDHPSRPSETDRQRAEEIWQAAESWSYLILEVASGRLVSLRSWVLRQGAFREEEVRILPISH